MPEPTRAQGLTVAILGCGLIGRKRAEAIRPADRVVGVFDPDEGRAAELGATFNAPAYRSVAELLRLKPDVVVVAATHDALAPLAEVCLDAGCHVLVEKPAGLGATQVRRLQAAAERADRQVKVGFNHRFHPALWDLAEEVHSGAHGELMHLRGRYGHGGRPGYDREWRAQPEHSGGGELIDQGMHLLDLAHWLAGPLALHSSLLRTQFWDTTVEDNAALILSASEDRAARWAMLHVTWTEWKNMFSLEVYCRRAKLQVDGLVRSYGTQSLRIYRMGPELGPPELELREYGAEDASWRREWEHFAGALEQGSPLLGSLEDAAYAWGVVEAAYAASPTHHGVRDRVFE